MTYEKKKELKQDHAEAAKEVEEATKLAGANIERYLKMQKESVVTTKQVMQIHEEDK